MSVRIGLVTSRDYPELIEGDRRLMQRLDGVGFSPEAVVWTDPDVRWDSFDALLVRSTWDYHRHYERFRRWVREQHRRGIKLLNPVSILDWNLAKTYMRDLREWGLPHVPTRCLLPPFRDGDRRLTETVPWRDLIVKPVVGAGARDLVRLRDPGRSEWCSVLHSEPMRRGCLVQPFMEEIKDGEWSLIFLNNRYSHAVQKHPDQGDFRVQERYGGRRAPAEPPPWMKERVVKIYNRIRTRLPGSPVYARLDLLVVDHDVRLIEVEMVEPDLYLDTPSLAGRFANRLQRWFTEPISKHPGGAEPSV